MSKSKQLPPLPEAPPVPETTAAARFVDLRSDTVTKPTEAMREVMLTALVGDDVLGDDPTTLQLEAYAATVLGKEAALFVPAGSMGNLIAVTLHCNAFGSEFIVGDRSHIHLWEQGTAASVAGAHARVVSTLPDGTLPLAEIEAAVRSPDVHAPVSRLVCLETTHNECGGKVLSLEYIDACGALAKKHGLKLHIDGARLGNAATALGVPLSRVVQAADSAMMCLSKGLAAPVGSVLVGTAEFIAEARRVRKALGGGMRQTGVLAAAGMLALTDMLPRLHEDHDRAQQIGVALHQVDGLEVHGVDDEVWTNFVHVQVTKPGVDFDVFTQKCQENDVLVGHKGNGLYRLCTHYMIEEKHVDKIVAAMAAALED